MVYINSIFADTKMSSNLIEIFKDTFDLENHDWQSISIVLLMLYGILQFLAINFRETNYLQDKSTRYAEKRNKIAFKCKQTFRRI